MGLFERDLSKLLPVGYKVTHSNVLSMVTLEHKDKMHVHCCFYGQVLPYFESLPELNYWRKKWLCITWNLNKFLTLYNFQLVKKLSAGDYVLCSEPTLKYYPPNNFVPDINPRLAYSVSGPNSGSIKPFIRWSWVLVRQIEFHNASDLSQILTCSIHSVVEGTPHTCRIHSMVKWSPSHAYKSVTYSSRAQ